MAAIEIIITPSADADVNGIVDFLEKTRSPKAAIRFINAFYKQLNLLESTPEIDTPSLKIASVRKKIIDKHNVLYYELLNDVLYVLRVIDTRSNPDANPYLA